jgi:tetratricopeptide (TPR) repeat protein
MKRGQPTLMKTVAILCLALVANIAVEAQSDSAKALFQRGQVEFAAGRYKPAFEHYRKATSLDTNYVDAYRALGLAAMEVRQFEVAKQSFKKVLQSNPADPVAIESMGNIAFSFRRWDDAIAYGQKMLDLKVGKRVNYIIGKSYYEKENFGSAFRFLDAAYKEEPQNAEIPFLFARSFVEMSNYKMAVKYYQEAIALDSSKVSWIYELGMAYQAVPDDKAAVPIYELAIAKGYKMDNDVMENLSSAYIAACVPEKGIAMLEKMLEMRPADLDLLYFMGDTYYRMGKYDQAITHWDKILSYDKQNARSLYMIGMAFQKKGDTKKGQAICDKAIELDPCLTVMRKEKQGAGF